MYKKILGILVCTLLITASLILIPPTNADWNPEDGYKMHFPQMPDPNGWDADIMMGWTLGDDWKCSETGFVSDIHIWYSWLSDIVGQILMVPINIYSNVPANDQIPYSRPGQKLWSQQFGLDEFTTRLWGYGDQGFMHAGGDYLQHNHNQIWQLNIVNITNPFLQEEGEIYWLVIPGIQIAGNTEIGWKTANVDEYPEPYTGSHYMDDAVYNNAGWWNEIHDPITGESMDLAFVINGEEVCQDIVYVDDDYKIDNTPRWFIDHFPTIQMALDRLDAGGTAIIYDGEYDEDLIIDDYPCDNTGITIMGAYECFPTDEVAVIQGHTIISVNDVTIKYLEYKPTTDAAITVEAGVTGTTLEWNKFRRDCITDAIGVQALGSTVVEAEHNWWGEPDGPSGGIMDDGKTAAGLGVKNIGQVMVEPWIGIHAEIAEPTGTMEVELGTPVTFDATGSFAYSFGECCELTEIPMQYLWDFGDGLQSANMIATHVFDQVGTYQVTLMVDSFGIPNLYSNFMYDWAYVTIHVVTEDTTLTANADGGNLGGYKTIVNEPIQLKGDAYGGNGEYTWHWNFGDQTADSNLQNPIHTYTKPGTYTATLTVFSDGETATDTATVYDIDELFVTINDANTVAGIETMFAASIKGGTPPYSIKWDFGDRTSSQETNPIHIYNSPGIYIVTVTVTDDNKKTATDTATITVQEENIIEEAEIKEVKGGLGIKATINAGEYNCHWEITVEGMVFLGGENNGTIDANTQETVKLGFSIALGNVNITVKAADIQKQYIAFALGQLFLNLQEA